MGQCISNIGVIQSQKKTSLKNATYDTVDVFEPPSGFCKVLDAYDADTCRVALPMADGTLAKFTLRLIGIDAPERKPAKNSELHDLEKAAAMRCRAKFLTMVTEPGVFNIDFKEAQARKGCGESKKILRLEGHMFDKYGRILAKLYDKDLCINDELVKNGWVRRYDGSTRQPWTKKELKNILSLRE